MIITTAKNEIHVIDGKFDTAFFTNGHLLVITTFYRYNDDKWISLDDYPSIIARIKHDKSFYDEYAEEAERDLSERMNEAIE